MEVDTVPLNGELETISRVETHPLALDLSKRCSLFLQDLGVASSSKPRLPTTVAQVIFDYALNFDEGLSAATLLQTLSGLLSIDGMSGAVIRSFGPILPDLLARWLEDTGTLSAEIWESRLQAVASLAALRPDLWRYVSWHRSMLTV
jgi:midasin